MTKPIADLITALQAGDYDTVLEGTEYGGLECDLGAYRGFNTIAQHAKANAARAHVLALVNAKLVEALEGIMPELEEVLARYKYGDETYHPAMEAKFNRDTEPFVKGVEAIALAKKMEGVG